MISTDLFKKAMQNVASTVAIVAAKDGRYQEGLTVTSYCSVSIDPCQILVCINHHARALEVVKKTGCFSLHILSERDHAVSTLFSKSGANKFMSDGWREEGDFLVYDKALVSFLMRLDKRYMETTHDLIVGGVESIVMPSDEDEGKQKPLIYHKQSYGL